MASNNEFIKRVDSDYVTPVGYIPMVIKSIQDTIIPHDDTPPTYYTLSNSSDKKITVTDPNGQVTLIANDYTTGGTYTPRISGQHVIRYEGAIFKQVLGAASQNETSPFKISFTFTAVPNYDPLPKWTIASVIDRVLNLCEPHLMSEQPRFKLDAAQHAEFENIQAPEFAFTQKTLKEILDEIGGFIHGVPRLIKGESGEFDTFRYDMLGGTEPAPLSAEVYQKQYVTKILTHNIENYATELDSSVDNLVNTLDDSEGGITEPYALGYKTVRSEELYARITEGNMEILTTLPIYKVQSLFIRDPETNKSYDITAYVFEGSDYGRLSSFQGNYPTSKAFAIYYERGKRGIHGLAFKSPNVVNGAASNYAITNILKAVGGTDISADWWGKDGGQYSKLAFQIVYTPIFSSRVQQHKPYYVAGEFKRSLAYNQGASLIETRYYGENLKGVIARMGNPEIVKTFKLSSSAKGMILIPYIGRTWDSEYYVSGVACAMYADHVDCTVSLSKDFNRLSQYIGINSQWRAYEVSEQKAYDRDTVYSDYVVIGEPITSDRKQLYSIEAIQATFTQSGDTAHITAGVVQTYDENGTLMHEVTLPVISSSFGNTLDFDFYFEDNYSAGAKSVDSSTASVSGYWQTDVPYGDYYGRVETIGFNLCPRGSLANVLVPSIGFDLPQGAYGDAAEISTDTADRLVIKKNGGETLRMHYSIKYVSNDRGIIMGNALTRNCPLVRDANSSRTAALYVVPKAIGKFDRTIDLSSATQIVSYSGSPTNSPISISAINRQLNLVDQVSTVSGAAWAIADRSTGEILLARNMPIEEGTTLALPTLTFTHNIP